MTCVPKKKLLESVSDPLATPGLSQLPQETHEKLLTVCLAFLCNAAMSAGLAKDIRAQKRNPVQLLRDMKLSSGTHQEMMAKLETRLGRYYKL